MDTHQAILTKLDVRQYSPKKVPVDVKLKVLEAARASGTGNNKQHLRFILVQNKESIRKLAEDSTSGPWGGLCSHSSHRSKTELPPNRHWTRSTTNAALGMEQRSNLRSLYRNQGRSNAEGLWFPSRHQAHYGGGFWLSRKEDSWEEGPYAHFGIGFRREIRQ